VVSGRVIGNTKFEPIPIAVELFKPPSIETVPPGIDFFHCDRGAEHEEVKTVIDVVPQSRVAKSVAFAGTFFAGEPVGGFAVLARIAVAEGVEVNDGVV
jgi:hypothetical protein